MRLNLLPSEKILAEIRPSKKLPLVWLCTKSLPSAFIAAFLLFFLWSAINAKPGPASPPPYSFVTGMLFVGGGVLTVLLLSYLYQIFLARTLTYYVTNQRFVFQGGLLRLVTHAVQHDRVTDVQVSQNIVEQLLAVSSISLFTPGTASIRPKAMNQPMPELRLEGLQDGDGTFVTISTCLREAKRPD